MLTEEEIKKALRMLGAKTSNRGYSYIAYGMLLALKDKSYLEYVTKSLYVDIAHRFHTSAGCVERDIRTAIESIWQSADKTFLTELCGTASAMQRPSNKKFFEMMHAHFTQIPCDNNCIVLGTSDTDFWQSKQKEECPQIKALREETEKLREENRRLRDILKQK